jgi:hypothetical protein
MPIPPNRMEPILTAEATATLRQVVKALLSRKPYDQWSTVAVQAPTSAWITFTLAELNDAADQLGPAVLDRTLGELLSHHPPSPTVERLATNPNQAERDAMRAPGRRLLVLEGGTPVGVVSIKSRGGIRQMTVVEFYKAEAGLEKEEQAAILALLDRHFLLLRPQVTLTEADQALDRADAQYAIVPLPDKYYALLERRDLQPHLPRLSRYTFDQIFAARQRTGERLLSKPLPGVDISRARPGRSEDVIVLQAGRPIGFFPNPKRGAEMGAAKGAEAGATARFVNAWFKDHASSQPLARGTPYDLGINVGAQRADSYVHGETYRGPVDQDVYVGLVGDPDVWRIDGPTVQKLHIPAARDSEPLFFKVTPLKPGQQQLVAHFYHRNHLIQTVEITGIQVIVSGEVDADTVRGQKPVAVTLTRTPIGAATSDRDANLYIEWLPDQDRFRFTFFSAPASAKPGDGPVLHSARISLTPDQMQAMAEAARDTIETYLVAYQEDNLWPFHLLSTVKGQQPSDAAYRRAIMALARLGYRWFIELFYRTDEPALKAEAEALGDLLLNASAGGPLRIQIVSSDFYLPWNLVYTAPSGKREPLTDKTANVQEGIWGFRHIIEQLPARDLSYAPANPIVGASGGLKMSANVNKHIDGTAYKPASEQVAFLQAKASDPQLGLELTTRFSEDDVRAALQDEESAEEVMYFYCHAMTKGDPKTRFEASRLILTDEGHALTITDLITETFGLAPLPKAPLVFLNACGSGQMDARFYDSFVQFMRERGARTVIGTLNDTPIVAGAEFAKKFFEQFLQGGPENSAANLLFRLRRELLDVYRNPIGLSYALFYSGDTYVGREA